MYPSFKDIVKRNITLSTMAIWLSLGISLTALIFSVYSSQALSDANVSLKKHLIAKTQLQQLMALLVEAESSQRGYILTGKENYLTPYYDATASINTTLDTLRNVYVTEPDLLPELSKISRPISGKMTELELTLTLQKRGQTAAAKEIIETDIGKIGMDTIRKNVDALSNKETIVVDDLTESFRFYQQLSQWGVLILIALNLIAFFLTVHFMRRAAQMEHINRLALEAEKKRLDQLVAERTSELSDLTEYLQVVREEERATLARELHDELGAVLTAAKLDSMFIRAKLKNADPLILNKLSNLTTTLDDGIKLKRKIIEDLRPSTLTNLGFAMAIKMLCEEFSERANIGLDLRCQDDLTIHDSLGIALYRIVQESLTNIAKYAQASAIQIVFDPQGTILNVSIKDNGQGFEPEKLIKGHGHGLISMRQRIAALRGKFSIQSAPGQGTLIQISVPITLQSQLNISQPVPPVVEVQIEPMPPTLSPAPSEPETTTEKPLQSAHRA